MDLGFIKLQMGQFMKGNGVGIKSLKENKYLQMGMYMMGNGEVIKGMAKEIVLMLMEINILDFGKMT